MAAAYATCARAMVHVLYLVFKEGEARGLQKLKPFCQLIVRIFSADGAWHGGRLPRVRWSCAVCVCVRGGIKCAVAWVADVVRGQGGVLRGELDQLSTELRRVCASLRGSFENLVNHCSFTFSTSSLHPATGKPIQIGHRTIKVVQHSTAYTRSHSRTCLSSSCRLMTEFSNVYYF